jgi:hypothetical protein
MAQIGENQQMALCGAIGAWGLLVLKLTPEAAVLTLLARSTVCALRSWHEGPFFASAGRRACVRA